MDICNLSDEIVKKFQNVTKILSECKNVLDREKWLKLVKGHLSLLNRALKNRNSIGIRRKIHTNIGHLKKVKILIKNLGHIGCGLGGRVNRSSRVKWEDINSVFSGRIRSGLIINLKHKDMRQFFDDSFFLFKSRINNILKSQPTIKVNACFCGEFIKHKINSEEMEFKYFNTKNGSIDISTDLKLWFKEYIVDKILNKLEEF